MTAVRRALGYRLVDTFLGDTIHRIAERELGDPARWTEIVAYNALVYPYVVDQIAGLEDAAADGTVFLAGERIKIPSSKPTNAVSDPTDIFGRDVALSDGCLTASASGDLALVADLDNLKQALNHRLATHLRELVQHRDYGNPLFDIVGEHGSPVNNQLAGDYGKRTLLSDPRVDRVDEVTATFEGDTSTVEAVAITTDGRPLPVGGDA